MLDNNLNLNEEKMVTYTRPRAAYLIGIGKRHLLQFLKCKKVN